MIACLVTAPSGGRTGCPPRSPMPTPVSTSLPVPPAACQGLWFPPVPCSGPAVRLQAHDSVLLPAPGRRPDKWCFHVHSPRGGAVTSRRQNAQDPPTELHPVKRFRVAPFSLMRPFFQMKVWIHISLWRVSAGCSAPAAFREQFNRRRASWLPSRAIRKPIFPGHPSDFQDPRWDSPGRAYLSRAAARLCCESTTVPRTARVRPVPRGLFSFIPTCSASFSSSSSAEQLCLSPPALAPPLSLRPSPRLAQALVCPLHLSPALSPHPRQMSTRRRGLVLTLQSPGRGCDSQEEPQLISTLIVPLTARSPAPLSDCLSSPRLRWETNDCLHE